MDPRRARDYRPVLPADQPAPVALAGRRTFQPSRAALRLDRVLIWRAGSLDRLQLVSTPAAAQSNRAKGQSLLLDIIALLTFLLFDLRSFIDEVGDEAVPGQLIVGLPLHFRLLVG